MNEISLQCYSQNDLFDKTLWNDLLSDLQEILGHKLSNLDDNDPIRKNVTDIEAASEFICSIGEQETSRYLFGKFGNSKISLHINLTKGQSKRANSISLYFPGEFANDLSGISKLHRVFNFCNLSINPFYSFCDFQIAISSKKKANNFAVNLEAELPGVFWLTYMNRNYVEYFGEAKFDEIPQQLVEDLEGITIVLGDSPNDVIIDREEIESFLGKDSFVDPALKVDKPIGIHALTLEQLRR